MITDPSWLYSTIAQSSAAIVAIIGGFITVSVLTLNAEIRGLWRRFRVLLRQYEISKEKDEEETTAESQSTVSEAAKLKYDVESFRTPRIIWFGVGVLSYLSASGILLPIIAIGYELFCPLLRNLIVVLFTLGIIGILVFIVLLIRTLRRTT